MQKVLKSLFGFALKNRFFIFFLTACFTIAGVASFLNTPIEAFPDVTNTQIIIITQWPGQSAEEMERAVTIPIEISMGSVQRKTSVRSITMFGLSVVKIIFDDGVEDAFARQQINFQLVNVSLPDGVSPEVEPPYGPTGEIYRYVLQSKTRSTRELLAWQTWVVDRQLRSVEGVADINAFGGEKKIYEVSVNPYRLTQYGITPLEVLDAVKRSNLNVGGDVIEKNNQAYVVRGIGMLTSVADIENIIVAQKGGFPILVRQVADVRESASPRVGQVGLDDRDDVVEGIVVMRKGENPADVLRRLKARIQEIGENELPADVRIVPFYDRDELIHFCTHTVLHNLLEGIVLVTAVVFLFLADWRATVIVSMIIPLALLFAFFCMRLKGMSANLLSLGAVDFGIIIDGAVVMVEGLFVALSHQAHRLGMPAFNRLSKLGLIRSTGAEMGKAVFFSKLIIITALLPIFSFEKVEGKMFSPLAYTLGFALLGALLFTLTLVPLLVSILMRRNVREHRNPFAEFLQRHTLRAFRFTSTHSKASLAAAMILLGASLVSTLWLGSEFLPPLNEGALWVEAGLPMSTSLQETVRMAAKIRAKIRVFPEVSGVLTQSGRPNDGTDPSGFYYIQAAVNLVPKESWKRNITTEQLVDEIDKSLKDFPGIDYNYSQPITDNVEEAVAGMNCSQAVKIFGPDFKKLDTLANQVLAAMNGIRGVKDLGVLRLLGQPEISVDLNEAKMAAYGVSAADAQAIIETAIGGKTASQMVEGERKFDIRVRYPYEFRKSQSAIGDIMVPTLAGGQIPLQQVADIKTVTGPAFVFRDAGRRFEGVKFSVRGRDLGGTISEARKKVAAEVHLPPGYHLAWNGDFENQARANQRLAHVVPISLMLIFILLFMTFGNAKDAGLVLLTVPFALMGGILALHITHTLFGISAGVGFIALFGICVQNGVILISVFKKNLKQGLALADAIGTGVASRARPVVMTALMAALGLFPAAISTGIGSESQKPLAIVVIGGLFSATLLILLIFPILFKMAYEKESHP